MRRKTKTQKIKRAEQPQKKEKSGRMRNIVGFVLTLTAGILVTMQGYQGVTGAAITGNVVGTQVGSGIGSIAVISGILLLVASFLMVITETMHFGGMFAIVIGVLSAFATFGTSLIPSFIAVVGGFLGMTAE